MDQRRRGGAQTLARAATHGGSAQRTCGANGTGLLRLIRMPCEPVREHAQTLRCGRWRAGRCSGVLVGEAAARSSSSTRCTPPHALSYSSQASEPSVTREPSATSEQRAAGAAATAAAVDGLMQLPRRGVVVVRAKRRVAQSKPLPPLAEARRVRATQEERPPPQPQAVSMLTTDPLIRMREQSHRPELVRSAPAAPRPQNNQTHSPLGEADTTRAGPGRVA